MPKIFCCYRREDSSHQAGRLFDILAGRYGEGELFKDVNSMPLGLDFRRVLTEKVAQCDVLLALIGDHWLGAADASGARRIDNPHDYVRIEIESALRRNIPVVPVLVGRAGVPEAGDLPEGLRELSFRSGIAVRPDPDFRPDVDRLIRGIHEVLGTPAAPAPTPPPREEAPTAAPGGPPPVRRGPPLGENSLKYLRERVWKGGTRDGSSGTVAVPGGLVGAPTAPGRTVRVGILKSGNATYVGDIERALLAGLESRLARRGARLAPSHDCVEWGEEDLWPIAVERLLSRGGPNGFPYLVAIGTQAALALQATLGADFGRVPTLLLGVTYPRLAGLIDSENFRCEPRKVACIRFGSGLAAVASLLHHRIFPGRRLCFVYQAGIPQDEQAADELATTRLAREKVLRLLRLEGRLQAGDLADGETVYFSWYTFTRLFHDKEFSILKGRLVVSIMQDNVRDGLASVGVGTDHDWIGDRGAEMLADYQAAPDGNKPDWGASEVSVSPLIYWLNTTLAKAQGIEFSRATLDGAREVYD